MNQTFNFGRATLDSPGLSGEQGAAVAFKAKLLGLKPKKAESMTMYNEQQL